MHNLLFNNALETLLVDDSDAEEVVGRRVVASTGIVVVPLIAHILAGFLGLVVVCLGGLFLVSYNRQNNMASDPGTLGTKMALVAHSEMLSRDFNGIDECSAPDLCMEPRKYKLGTWGSGGEYRLDVVGVGLVELSIWMGLAETLVNIGLLTLLVILYKSSLRWNGLPTLSDTQFVSQIIFSFIPTVIATLLEPFWVLVGRYRALYQPYIELRRGNASPTSSLGLKYTNIPPVLIVPRALRHGHTILFLASMMVIMANILAVAFGGIFDRSSQPVTSDITTVVSTEGYPETFAKDLEGHWLVVNTNVIEGTDLPGWVTDEFYFLPFDWVSDGKTGLRTSKTQGYGGNPTCQLLAGNTFQQTSHWPNEIRPDINVTRPVRWRIGALRGNYHDWLEDLRDTKTSHWQKETRQEISIMMPGSDGDFVRCENTLSMDPKFLKSGTHPFAVEWVCDLYASNRSDQKAMQGCGSLILAGWGRGEANQNKTGNETTTKIQGDSRWGSRVERSKVIGELKYNDPKIFNRSTSVGNFTAQLAMPLAVHWRVLDQKDTLQTSPPSFEDAQQALSKFYKRFFTILLAQNQNTTFVPAGNPSRSGVGQFESIQPRMSIDPVMFYIAVVILGFQLLAGTIIFALTPRRLLLRFPYNLASEISFFHASSALSDVAGTANMTSAMRRRHLKRLGGTYGYGKFRGSDGENHVGIERMSMIRGYKEAVVTTSASSTILEETAMVRTAAVVTSASSSPPGAGEVSVEGAVSAAGNVGGPALAVDWVGTRAVSPVEGGTSMRAVTRPARESRARWLWL
ncbi:hypothetical protein B9Z19DRAFT_1129182 [Tuber borchii]|uniref:Uncharacterized protein n=1 Tax=Tuber borchii TaxID=42251 RepID=A0A2T6ZMT6_TUBBO|nr:hypothetical protein B9Z19DRAFT_1129182 [Tuber borchii]